MKKIAMLALLSALVAAPATAANMYAGVSVGSAQIDISGLDSTTSLGFFGGYTVNENFAVEIAYIDFGSQNLAGLTLDSNALSLSGVGFLPLNNQFSLFGKLGFAMTTLDLTGFNSENNTDLTYGFGAQINANEQVSVRLGYDAYTVGEGVTTDQTVISISGLFRF